MKFNLHQPKGNQPDWAWIPPDQRNAFQRLAARTNGIVSPGNAVSLAALGMLECSLGSAHSRGKTADPAWVGGSMILDVVDGTVANLTGTKSPLGEAVDAGCDLYRSARLLQASASHGWVPGWMASAVALRKIANAGATALAQSKGQSTHSSKDGKLAEACQSIMLGAALTTSYAQETRRPRLAATSKALTVLSTAAFVGFSIHSTWRYWRSALSDT